VPLISFAGSPYGGEHKLLPEWNSQPVMTPKAIIDHSIVGSALGAWLYFRDKTSLESHFIVAKTGRIWQLMDTGRQADANRLANAYALSIETEDDGNPDIQPWTEEQLRSLVWLHTKLRQVHPTIPNRESRSCDDPAGHGYHTKFGAPSCWTPVAKSCPGTIRKRQWTSILLPAYLAGSISEGDMAEVTSFSTEADKELRTAARLGSQDTLRSAVGTGPDDPASDWFDGERADTKAIRTGVDQIKALMTSPVPVVVDAAAVAAALRTDQEFLNAVANAVADELHQRGEA
jgi:N-acetylmuramoyl-L-alanine amidase